MIDYLDAQLRMRRAHRIISRLDAATRGVLERRLGTT
jgi:hypothetical protein